MLGYMIVARGDTLSFAELGSCRPRHGPLRSHTEASQWEVPLAFSEAGGAAISSTTILGWRSASNALPFAPLQFANNVR